MIHYLRNLFKPREDPRVESKVTVLPDNLRGYLEPGEEELPVSWPHYYNKRGLWYCKPEEIVNSQLYRAQVRAMKELISK